MRLGWSSHVYPLEAADFGDVPDYSGEPISAGDLPPNPVILLIRKGYPDSLVRGRDEIARCAGGIVNVRVVFVPSVARWNLLGTLVRVCRNRYRYHGTHVYHISAKAVRDMKLERAIRTTANPHVRAGQSLSQSLDRMARLLASLKRDGFRDDRPIGVMLCRTGGLRDSLRQGHHRVSACLECGIDRMAVEFSAAGVAPWQRWIDSRRIGVANPLGCCLDAEYDFIASIGFDCHCATMLRKFGLRSSSSPFDWLTSAPLETRLRLIETHFADFLEKGNLRRIEKVPGVSGRGNDHYQDAATGFKFFHDFSEALSFDESYAQVKAKYDRRIARFYDTVGKSARTLLVWCDLLNPLAEDVRRSAEARLRAVFPRKDVHLLSVASDDDFSRIRSPRAKATCRRMKRLRLLIRFLTWPHVTRAGRHAARRRLEMKWGLE